MKKIILYTALFCGFSTLSAQEWERAHPCPEFNNPYEYCGLPFRQAYVEYRLIKEGKEIEINMHDQVVRSGYFFNRFYNQWIGPYGSVTATTREKDLLRIFALISRTQIKTNDNFESWYLYPNFDLLDSMLEDKKEVIVQNFNTAFPNVISIFLWAGSPDYKRSHMSNISHIDFEGDIAEWKRMFHVIGVSIN